MRFGILGGLFGLFLLFQGGTRLSDSLAYSEPKTMPLGQFLQAPLKSGWVRLTDAYLDVPNTIAVYTQKDDDEAVFTATPTVTDVYVPLVTGPSQTSADKAKVVIESDDARLEELVQKATEGDEDAAAQIGKWEDKAPRTVEGMATSADSSVENFSESGLAADTVVISEGQVPRHWAIGLIILLGGCTILGSIAYSLFFDRYFR